MRKTLPFIAMILLCGMAAVLFLYSTPFGVGLTNDSSAYIGGARSLLAGKGYVRIGGDGLPRAITHFPPFYSIVLAGVSRLTGQDPLTTAKWVNLACAVLNQAFFMLTLLLLTGSAWGAVLGGVTFLCAGPVLKGQIYGLSEALYLTLFFAVLILSIRTARDHRTGMWLLTGLLCGALVITRYAGFAAAGALVVFILCVLPDAKERIRSLLFFLAGLAVPLAAWLLRSGGDEGSAVNRSLSLHLPAADKVRDGIRNLAGFFLPEFGGFVEKLLPVWGVVIAAGLLVLLGAVIFTGLRAFFHPSDRLAQSPYFAPALHGAAYMVMLFLTVCFIDGSTLFDDRILLPFYVCLMLLADAFCIRLSARPRLKPAGIILMLLFAVLLLEDELDLIKEFHRNGQGLAGEEWRSSETRLAAKELPEGKLLFCNRQTALSLLNDQPSFILPPMFDSASFSERESFEQDKQWMDDEVLSGNAFVIVFNYREMLEDAGDREWLETVLEGLPVFAEYSDGVIFGQ